MPGGKNSRRLLNIRKERLDGEKTRLRVMAVIGTHAGPGAYGIAFFSK